MGNIKILSRAGYQDMGVWRRQALTSINSTTLMSYNNSKFDLLDFSEIVMEVYVSEDFSLLDPILSFSTLNGNLIPFDGGFYLSVPSAVMDIEKDTYFYNLKGDEELLLSGKFIVGEHADKE